MANTREAMQVVLDLLQKYQINSINERYKIRERFTQEELEEYEAAMKFLDGSGAVG